MTQTLPSSLTLPRSHAATVRIVVGVMIAALLGAIDQTIVATALPTIGRELGDLASVSWVVLAYLLTAAVATPVFGKLSDIYGRRPVLLLAIAGFLAGSILCALAPTMLALILARGLQGVFGGALISLAQTVVGDVVPPSKRGRYQAYISAIFAASSIAGPTLGGLFVDYLHWSAIFWINVPLGAVAFVLIDHMLRGVPGHHSRHSLDITGAVLLAAATVSLLLAFNWRSASGWLDPRLLVLLATSAALWVIFVVWMRRAAEPFVPLDLLKDHTVARIFGGTVLAVGSNMGLAVYMPLYFQDVVGLTPAQSGVVLIALSGSAMIGSWLAGRLMMEAEHYKRPALYGLAISVFATLCLAALKDPPLPLLVMLNVLMGAGLGTYFPVSTISVQNAVAPGRLGVMTGMLNFVRTLAGTIIVAAFGTMVLGAAAADPGSPGPAGTSLATAFQFVFIASAICHAGAWFLLLGMREVPLRDH